MQSAPDILSFMDLLDLDEEVIDVRAKNIMDRNTFTNEHLVHLINLLQYKQLINKRENSECDNNNEFDFLVKLIPSLNEDNVDSVCKIINLVLSLQPSTVIDKSEHLLQQLFYDVHLPSPKDTSIDTDFDKVQFTMLQLKIINSILNVGIFSERKLSLPFLDIPIENMIFCKDEKLQTYFLTYTVPRLFDAVTGFNILDRIWDVLKENKDHASETALQVLCCLSNFYLPEVDSDTLKSDIIFHNQFWDFVYLGMINKDFDNSIRKKSIYLAKRAIDCVVSHNKDMAILTDNIYFLWDHSLKKRLKKMWDNYFVLLDSLDEKQGNIVMPSLKLFENVKNIGYCWLNCAFLIGLSHDNAQVRHQCLKYRLQMEIFQESDAMSILEALNDINLYEHASECEAMKNRIRFILTDVGSLFQILYYAPCIKWSPVPLFHLTSILSEVNIDKFLDNINPSVMMDLMINMLKIPCNNVVIRKAIHINMSHFVGKNCKRLHWRDYMNLYLHFQMDIKKYHHNPCTEFIKSDLMISDSIEFLRLVPYTHSYLDFALLYYEDHDEIDFTRLISDVMLKVQDTNSRQYSDKNECLDEAIFIVHLYKKILQYKHVIYDELKAAVPTTLQIVLEYAASLLASDIDIDIEKFTLFFEGLDYFNSQLAVYENEFLLQLYKSAIMLLNSNDVDLDKKTLSMFVCNACMKAPVMLKTYKKELLELNVFLNIMKNIKFSESLNRENSGRLRNAFYEKSCEIVYVSINSRCKINNNIIAYIYNVLDCGGYGCLKWILKMMNKIFPFIVKKENIKFDAPEFLNRVWKEVEELKSNSQYNVCIQEFISLITQDCFLKQPDYNNIVISYTNKIIDYAAIKSAPLYYLAKRLNELNVSFYSHLIYVFCEVLLYTFIPRKEHRIVENVCIDIMESSKYLIKHEGIYFNCNIKVLAVSILSKIFDPDVLNMITDLIMEKMEELFKNKQRYYSNSLHERSIEAALQHLLFIFFKCRKVKLDNSHEWVLEFLGKMPHQPYVRTYLEWYIALIYYFKGDVINEKIIFELKENKLPIQSQFIILYWIVHHKIKRKMCELEEFEYVMDYFLSNIMGPTYSTRMFAQYFAVKIYEANLMSDNPLEHEKYAHTVNVINIALEEAEVLQDKSFMKLRRDYYLQIFDIVEDLTPFAIYWGLPQLYEGFNDTIDTEFLESKLEIINESIVGEPDKFFNEWVDTHKYNWSRMRINLPAQAKKERCDFLEETGGTIQKKYIPWKNMSDIDVYNIEKKKNQSDLIVVASLIDKLPNLGGMARTSEVFGVQTYVVDSLRRLQDKQFQGLSVSAERWINVEEVRPGHALKEYLMKKKSEGYTVVAAEQTSNSTMIQKFKFPKKTLLLLGHEKEGIPCDLLPIMDNCVEIPQQGVIRSLNVHVTAAIFIWEYARQNML